MEDSPVRKTRYPDDSPVAKEIAGLRWERIEKTIKACQDTIRTNRQLREELKRIRARTRLLKRRLKPLDETLLPKR